MLLLPLRKPPQGTSTTVRRIALEHAIWRGERDCPAVRIMVVGTRRTQNPTTCDVLLDAFARVVYRPLSTVNHVASNRNEHTSTRPDAARLGNVRYYTSFCKREYFFCNSCTPYPTSLSYMLRHRMPQGPRKNGASAQAPPRSLQRGIFGMNTSVADGQRGKKRERLCPPLILWRGRHGAWCLPALLAVASAAWAQARQPSMTSKNAVSAIATPKDGNEVLRRGELLAKFGGCHDCHTPKLMTANGRSPMRPDCCRAILPMHQCRLFLRA